MVVPTATTRRPSRFASVTARAVASGISIGSGSMRCSSSRVGPQRPERARPDVQREVVDLDARAPRARASSSGVKCSPAVGAATDPSSRA